MIAIHVLPRTELQLAPPVPTLLPNKAPSKSLRDIERPDAAKAMILRDRWTLALLCRPTENLISLGALSLGLPLVRLIRHTARPGNDIVSRPLLVNSTELLPVCLATSTVGNLIRKASSAPPIVMVQRTQLVSLVDYFDLATPSGPLAALSRAPLASPLLAARLPVELPNRPSLPALLPFGRRVLDAPSRDDDAASSPGADRPLAPNIPLRISTLVTSAVTRTVETVLTTTVPCPECPWVDRGVMPMTVGSVTPLPRRVGRFSTVWCSLLVSRTWVSGLNEYVWLTIDPSRDGIIRGLVSSRLHCPLLGQMLASTHLSSCFSEHMLDWVLARVNLNRLGEVKLQAFNVAALRAVPVVMASVTLKLIRRVLLLVITMPDGATL